VIRQTNLGVFAEENATHQPLQVAFIECGDDSKVHVPPSDVVRRRSDVVREKEKTTG